MLPPGHIPWSIGKPPQASLFDGRISPAGNRSLAWRGRWRCEALAISGNSTPNLYQYPNGERTPLGARLIAIADTLDAMTSDWRYRKSPGCEAAHKELSLHAGEQFDPR